MKATLPRIGRLAELEDRTLRKLEEVTTVVVLEDSEVVALEGEPSPPVCFVLEGAVRAYRSSPEGREQEVARLRAGSVFFVPPAFSPQATAPATAAAVGPTRLARIAAPDFRGVVASSPDLAALVMTVLSTKLHHLVDLSRDISLMPVRARLARFLLEESAGADGPSGRWTHEAIAGRIGSVREVVSRTLGSFVREGLVRKDRHRIVVLDPDRLASEAGICT